MTEIDAEINKTEKHDWNKVVYKLQNDLKQQKSQTQRKVEEFKKYLNDVNIFEENDILRTIDKIFKDDNVGDKR
jgi:hypothetical protein